MTSILLGQPPTGAYLSTSTLDCSFANFSVFWLFWFCVCFYPITISGFGINYLFALTPLFYLMFGGKLHALSPLITVFGTLLILVFVIASIYQFEYYNEGFRRIISFILFMSIFSLSFLWFKSRELNSVLLAAIIVSCLISLVSIYKLISLGLVQSAFEAKDEVGSQRVGFLLIFSFWALFEYARNGSLLVRSVIIGASGLIFSGIILTFSRASIVAFVGSTVLYLMVRDGRLNLLRLIKPKSVLVASVCVLLFVMLGEYALPSIYQFLDERLFDFFVSGRVFDNIADSDTSEGTRFRIWKIIISYVIFNPLTGSGFLGSWIMAEDTGSAHNQYMDVLLRIGFFGFCIYIIILWRISRVLIIRHGYIFCGFSGVLIYGMFHETFKEPSGALLLAFLLSYYSMVIRKSRVLGGVIHSKCGVDS